jgi:propionyl-CoA carboxylase alpha chain
MSTAFIAEEFPDGFAAAADDEMRRRLAIVALAIHLRADRRPAGPRGGEGKFQSEDWVVSVEGERFDLKAPKAEAGAGSVKIVGPGSPKPLPVVSHWRPGEPLWIGTVDGVPLAVQVRRSRAGLTLSCRGSEVSARVMPPHIAVLDVLMLEKSAADAGRHLHCPMPGLVVAIDVAVGQKVRAGEPLAVVEAMKMENVLRATRDGTVAKILAAPGDILAVDAVIMEFE